MRAEVRTIARQSSRLVSDSPPPKSQTETTPLARQRGNHERGPNTIGTQLSALAPEDHHRSSPPVVLVPPSERVPPVPLDLGVPELAPQ